MLSWAKISGKALRLWAEAARKYPRLRDESAVVSATLPPASFTDPPERRLGALAPAAHVQARGPPQRSLRLSERPVGVGYQPSAVGDRRQVTLIRACKPRYTRSNHNGTVISHRLPAASPPVE